jgi:hypothetical protein
MLQLLTYIDNVILLGKIMNTREIQGCLLKETRDGNKNGKINMYLGLNGIRVWK